MAGQTSRRRRFYPTTKGTDMKRIIVAAAALLAVLPASLGLIGNASFAQSVPVRIPSQATVLDDRGGLSTQVQPGDDKGGPSTPVKPRDDKGGLSTPVKPGHDKVSNSGSNKADTGGNGSGNGASADGSGHT